MKIGKKIFRSQLPHVSVFVSAFNEERNVRQFLQSVLAQKEQGFVLDKIIVVSDGSTDKTYDIVSRMKNKKIKAVKGTKRVGKSTQLTHWYKKITSDIIVQSDADVLFANDRVIANLIQPLIANKHVVLCGGNPLPRPGTTTTEKAINHTVLAYAQLRHLVRKGNNIFSADGRLLALKTSFARKVFIPSDMIANDAFAYFSCIASGFQYRFVPKAVVTFCSPQTIKDQLRQNTRFCAAPMRMKRYFPAKLVENEYDIPRSIQFSVYVRTFIKNPLLCVYIYLLNIVCKINAVLVESTLNAKWAMASTTKHVSL